MSIATRKAGHEVPCATCGATLRVPGDRIDEPSDPQEATASASEPSNADAREPSAQHAGEHSRADGIVHNLAPANDSEGVELRPPDGELLLDDDDDPPVRFIKRKRADEELDMTPMVDVTFLLLIFFMVTATFGRQKVLLFPPPSSDKKGATQSVERVENIEVSSIRIGVDARNVVTIEEEKVNILDLATKLRERMRTELKSEAAITSDPRALHETVVKVVDACNEAGFQKIRLGGKSAAPE
jgi:biopolymer transport protein ExbD